jgi:hypothetical protein
MGIFQLPQHSTDHPFKIPPRFMKIPSFITASALGLLVIAASSCSTGPRSPSGFLSNYSQFDTGYGAGDAVSAFLKPGVDFSRYTSVMIDPVTTVVSSPGISPAVRDQLAAYLGEALAAELSGSLTIVGTPGPTTLRVRTALTDVIEGQSFGKPTTIVHTSPQVTLSGNLGSAELAAFISNVSFEGEILDSATGERLAGLSDHRLGAKREATAETRWTSVRSATRQGAKRLHERFIASSGR